MEKTSLLLLLAFDLRIAECPFNKFELESWLFFYEESYKPTSSLVVYAFHSCNKIYAAARPYHVCKKAADCLPVTRQYFEDCIQHSFSSLLWTVD